MHTPILLFLRLLRLKFDFSFSRMSIFEAHQDWGRNLMVMDNGNLSESYGEFCDKDPIVCAWNISSESELTSLAVLQSRSAQQSLSDVLDQGM